MNNNTLREAEEDTDKSYDSDDLDNMLDSMDIDSDFQCWTSFRSSMSIRNSSTSPQSSGISSSRQVDPKEQADMDRWQGRIDRPEVYSKRYTPSEAERKELTELESFLGMNPKRSLRNLFRSKSGGNKSASSVADNGGDSSDRADKSRQAWNQLIHPEQEIVRAPNLGKSILLKRGPVLYGSNGNGEPLEAEAILLTHGLIIATVVKNDGQKAKNVVARSFARALLWPTVESAGPIVGDETAWELALRTGDDECLSFVCANVPQREAWLDAMERVLVEHHMHNANQTATSNHYHHELGWQYKVIRRPAFTMAVTGKNDHMRLPSINARDKYNGYAPLHYAVRLEKITSIRRLLDAGADPNVKDVEGRTPMYYATRDKLSRSTVSLLESYGAKASELAAVEERGELFGRIAATESEREGRRQEEEHKKAVAAQVQMNENMRLLQERGQKIEDLDSKARELNQNAANYADLARQLKEQTKKKSKWGF